MNPLVQLPKTANILSEYEELVIRDHTALNRNGFLTWVLEIMFNGEWGVVLPQLISQEFRFEAVREQCIKDLKDPKKHYGLFENFAKYGIPSLDCWKKLTKSTMVEKFFSEIIKKISDSKNWVEFHYIMNDESDYRTELSKKMKEGVKSCNR